ncbi:unnamed protein product [Rangifer tarandus platyrhynchus]|uniref:Uncharacterized protein n=1 Tax=Rangifer tarandus platyrhynchus TaxID=3082113 RepID=A0ABN8ZEP6_RANTA|nr:unnamed protein product [Rangifer tarandus platyrhynchus]
MRAGWAPLTSSVIPPSSPGRSQADPGQILTHETRRARDAPARLPLPLRPSALGPGSSLFSRPLGLLARPRGPLAPCPRRRRWGLAGVRGARRAPSLHLHRDRGAHARAAEGGGRAGRGPEGPAPPRRRWGSGIGARGPAGLRAAWASDPALTASPRRQPVRPRSQRPEAEEEEQEDEALRGPAARPQVRALTGGTRGSAGPWREAPGRQSHGAPVPGRDPGRDPRPHARSSPAGLAEARLLRRPPGAPAPPPAGRGAAPECAIGRARGRRLLPPSRSHGDPRQPMQWTLGPCGTPGAATAPAPLHYKYFSKMRRSSLRAPRPPAASAPRS